MISTPKKNSHQICLFQKILGTSQNLGHFFNVFKTWRRMYDWLFAVVLFLETIGIATWVSWAVFGGFLFRGFLKDGVVVL